MKFHVFTILIFALMFSCKAKDSAADIKNDLMISMQKFLYANQVHNDSSNVKYRVQDVIYFEDKDKYICEFTVNMKEKLFDTTGVMKANVTKDFKKVTRLY